MEREIVWAFYKELVNKLKENSKINRTNFVVYDELTKNAYALDKEWSILMVKNDWSKKSKKFREDLLKNNFWGRSFWTIKDEDLEKLDTQPCNLEETKEIFMNPMIMWRMIKAMNRRM